MSSLIKTQINSKKSHISRVGLLESNYEDQLDLQKYPAIYVDLSSSDINYLSIDSGILTIVDLLLQENRFNIFSKTLLEVCEIINNNTNGGAAYLLSDKLGLVSSLFITRFYSKSIMNIQSDKSPLLLSDFHPDILENILTISDTNPEYSIIDTLDEHGDTISYSLIGHNLYMNRLGRILVEYNLNKFILTIKEENLITTKYLRNFALDYPDQVSIAEKNILLTQFIKAHNSFNA